MDKKIIFVKTQKGDNELKSKTGHLFGDVKRVLVLVDNKSTVEELTKRAAPSLRTSFDEILQELMDDGYIHEKDKENAPKTAVTPAAPKVSSLKMAMPAAKPQDSGEELDFTSILPKMTPQALAAEGAKAKTQTPPTVAQKPPAEAESQKEVRAREEAEARMHAEREAARIQAGQEEARKKAQLAAEQAKAKAQAEAKALTDAETARIQAEHEAARAKAEQVAALAREKAEAEAKARAEAEAARLKVEQEAARIKAELAAVQAKAQAESQARAEVEAARLKAEKEAAKARAEAEKAAAEAKIEAEMKALAQAKAQAEAQAEAQARARLKAEQEALAERQREERAQQLKAEQAAAQALEKAKAEAEKSVTPISQAVVSKLQEDKVLKTKAEEEARQLAESQAKKWAEAEERAKAQAQQAETAQQVVPKPEKTKPAKTVVRASKTPRQPLPLGKISAALVVLAVVFAFALPYVWPMQEYITQIERNLSAQLKQPVKIGNMRPALLPLPKLELKNVVVGKGSELQAGIVTLNFSIAALFNETRTIKRAEITDLSIKAESFSKALAGIQAAAATANFPVNQMVIHKARISGGDLNFPALSGDIYFDGKGNLIKSVLGSEDGKFTMQLQPQQSRWQISAKVKENSLPLLPGVVFSEAEVKGEIRESEANFSVIEGMLYKGKLLGSARLNWKSGWQLQGQMDIKALALQDIWPQSGLNGDLNGRASVMLRAANLAQLGKVPRIEGEFSVKKGFINGIDMVETARVAKRQGVSAGRTHFDELNGTVLAEGDNVQLRQIKISAGILTGNGSVDVTSGQQLSGRMNIDLKIRADMGSMPLTLSGTLSQPVWRTGP